MFCLYILELCFCDKYQLQSFMSDNITFIILILEIMYANFLELLRAKLKRYFNLINSRIIVLNFTKYSPTGIVAQDL